MAVLAVFAILICSIPASAANSAPTESISPGCAVRPIAHSFLPKICVPRIIKCISIFDLSNNENVSRFHFPNFSQLRIQNETIHYYIKNCLLGNAKGKFASAAWNCRNSEINYFLVTHIKQTQSTANFYIIRRSFSVVFIFNKSLKCVVSLTRKQFQNFSIQKRDVSTQFPLGRFIHDRDSVIHGFYRFFHPPDLKAAYNDSDGNEKAVESGQQNIRGPSPYPKNSPFSIWIFTASIAAAFFFGIGGVYRWCDGRRISGCPLFLLGLGFDFYANFGLLGHWF